jgi:addiction module HigA family antidote
MQSRERSPIHPGEILAEDVLAELNMSGRQLASALGISPNRISEILRGRRAITADTALRLSRWLGTSPTVWLNLQQAYDLEMAKLEAGDAIEREVVPRAEAA